MAVIMCAQIESAVNLISSRVIKKQSTVYIHPEIYLKTLYPVPPSYSDDLFSCHTFFSAAVLLTLHFFLQMANFHAREVQMMDSLTVFNNLWAICVDGG